MEEFDTRKDRKPFVRFNRKLFIQLNYEYIYVDNEVCIGYALNFTSPLIRGTMIRRYRRSLAEVRLESGEVETVYSPGLGQMRGCYEKGAPVMLSESPDPGRKHRLTWELINIGNVWVGVNPLTSRRILQESLEQSVLPSFHDYSLEQETIHDKKADLILQGMENTCFVNTFGVSWGEDGSAWFPDNSNQRLRDQFYGLAEIPQRGHRAVAFFLVQRADCANLRVSDDADTEDRDAITTAYNAGVEFLVYQANISFDMISLGKQIPFELR